MLVLGFFLMALASLLVILLAAPEVYDQALRLPGTGRATEIAFLAALTAFITLLAVGVVRRWRWAFWLILVAFLAGVLRVPVAILQLTGALPQTLQSGMSPSRALLVWPSSPSDWPCWPAIDAPASGEPSNGATTLPCRRGRHAGDAGPLAVSGSVSLACQAASASDCAGRR